MPTQLHAKKVAGLEHRDYGYILAIACMALAALALVVACVMFTPASVGSGITSEMLVGP